jgi:hypothetical protein
MNVDEYEWIFPSSEWGALKPNEVNSEEVRNDFHNRQFWVKWFCERWRSEINEIIFTIIDNRVGTKK